MSLFSINRFHQLTLIVLGTDLGPKRVTECDGSRIVYSCVFRPPLRGTADTKLVELARGEKLL